MRVSADRVAVVRARAGVGELLCVVPALRALREGCPHAQVTLIGADDDAAWFAETFSTYVDELLPFPGFPGVPGPPFDARATAKFLRKMHQRELDLAIQLHGWGIAINAFTAMLGATHTAGSVGASEPPADPDFFVEYADDEPEPVRLLRVIERLGASPSRGAELEFPLDDQRPEDGLQPGAYACLHPGESDPKRLESAVLALEREGLQVVELDGAHDARATAALVRDANVLVGDDPGLAHLAAAVGTRHVCVDDSEPALAATGTDR